MKISMKFVAASVAAQIITCASLWLTAILFSSDSLFNIIVYFYWPCIILVAWFLGTRGESAMIAVPIYGMALGMIFYSVILAVVLSFLKKKRD